MNNMPKSSKPYAGKPYAGKPYASKIALFVSAVVLAAGAALYAASSDNAPGSSGQAFATLRHVIVIAKGAVPRSGAVADRLCGDSSGCINGKNAVDVVVLQRGAIPGRPIRAIVETDLNCAPDYYGISHCTNDLLLADGTRLQVRHDHNMQIYPCLKPGEIVMVEGELSA